MRIILHFLSIRSKPCLIKLMIKNIFITNLNKNGNQNEKNKFIKYLVKNDLLNTLLFLLSTYAYPDIVNEIINLFSIISLEIKSLDINNTSNNFFNKDNNIEFISNSLLPIYIRIEHLANEEENNNSNNNKKKITMSEIIIHDKKEEDKLNNNNNNVIKKKENQENILILEDEKNNNNDEETDMLAFNKKLFNIEKPKYRFRKISGDNYSHSRKLNLEKMSTVDLDINIKEENFEENRFK